MLSMSSRIQSKYQVQRHQGKDLVLGAGSYGVVYGAIDSTGARVAVKKIKRQIFSDASECTRLYREIKILRALGAHENIISLMDIEAYVDSGRLMEINLVFVRYETTLGYLIRSKHILSIKHIACFVYQIFNGVFYIHSANIVHRDLKPDNILINSNCRLVICDFGIARPIPVETEITCPASSVSSASSELTQYIVTRWYRSPELIEECQVKAQPSDIWSVGCILAELFLGTPILNGNSAMHVLFLINNLLLMDIASMANHQEKLCEHFKNIFARTVATEDAIDLMIKLLKYNPNERLTAQGALGHPFLNSLSRHIKISSFSEPIDETFIAFEAQTNKTTDVVHRYILEEIGIDGSMQSSSSPSPAESLIVTQSIFSSVKQMTESTDKPEVGIAYEK